MSLLICSNIQDEYASYDALDPGHRLNIPTGVQNPGSFQNHLRNPMKIAPNSEVAVASVKINRLPIYDIKPNNKFFYNLGTALEDANGNAVLKQSQTLSIPQPVIIPEGVYTQNDFRDELSRTLKEVQNHPSYWNQVIVSDKHPLVAPLDIWQGYDFSMKSLTKPTDNYADKMTDWRGYDDRTSEEPEAGKWSVVTEGASKTCTITKLNATETDVLTSASVINTNCPMDLVNGQVSIALFNDTNVANSVSFAFTRPKLYKDTPNPFLISDGNENTGYPISDIPYGDYRVSWVTDEVLDTKNALVLTQSVWDAENGGTILKEISYWLEYPAGDNGLTNPVKAQIDSDDIEAEGSTTKSGFFGTFQVSFIGSGILLKMGYNTAANGASTISYRVICDTTGTTAVNRAKPEYVWTPINQNKWALYLSLSMEVKDHAVKITNMVWNEDEVHKHLTNPYLFGTETKVGSSWWSRCLQSIEGGRNGLDIELARLVEWRENQQMKASLGSTGIKWEDLTADSDAVALSRAFVLNTPRDRREEVSGLYYPASGANMGMKLGFPYWDAISSAQVGIKQNLAGGVKVNPTAVWIIGSAKTPELAVHSAFVKVPSLTAQSFNFCKSIPSQILYHMPRFDNSGRQYGDLFFECAEKTYIDMKNIDFLNLNALDVMIVDKDERVVKDLTGDTTITLHIRHKTDRY